MTKKTPKYRKKPGKSLEVRESATADAPAVVNVRAARDGLSRLLDQAAQGNEVIITSDGRPKAKLVPVDSPRRAFKVDWDLLASMPLRESAPSADELIRKNRDERD